MKIFEAIGGLIIMYALGAVFIQKFCSDVILKIPLLDAHALKIRNFLCVIWFIFSIIVVIYTYSNLNKIAN